MTTPSWHTLAPERQRAVIDLLRALARRWRHTARAERTAPNLIAQIDADADEVEAAAARLETASKIFDLVTHLEQQREFSLHTFGPGDRAQGVVDHIRKELREIEAEPAALGEWIDVVMLGFDGAWRSGAPPEAIAAALAAKLEKNKRRTWPDWRTADPNKAIEHDRTGEGRSP